MLEYRCEESIISIEEGNLKNKEIQLMNPKIDFVFKSIFGNEKHPKILISFLNAVLGYEDKNKIVKVQIENPNIEKENIEDKYSILDIKATANDDTKLDIEIQIRNNYDMIPRTIYYLSKLVENQVKENENYNTILKSITINLLDFKLLSQNNRIHNTFIYKEKETNEVLTDLTEIHFIEFPKMKNQEIEDTLLNEWLIFIENPENEAIEMIEKKVVEIAEAKRVLEVLSLNNEARIKYEARQKNLKDRTSSLETAERRGLEQGLERGLEQGLQQGLQQGLLEGIQGMLEIKFGEKSLWLMDLIKKAKSTEELEKIKNYIKKINTIDEFEKMLRN